MKFNDAFPPLAETAPAAPWWSSLADDATLEATVLKRPLQGREAILGLLGQAKTLYDYQRFAFKTYVTPQLFIESYHAAVGGVEMDTTVLVHLDEAGRTDSIVINHYPLGAALLFSTLMWEKVGEKFGDLYLNPDEARGLGAVIPHVVLGEVGGGAGG